MSARRERLHIEPAFGAPAARYRAGAVVAFPKPPQPVVSGKVEAYADNRLAPARGVVFGVGMGALMWVGLGTLAWQFFR